ncbi:MAG: agmatinase family protein [Haliscomenobacter sp.]|nr:agmatinase family protein [Haliscomenobacter sp.]MBK7474788.1 agmatinase family protein [Haliscomenobacter sp.]
MTKADVINHFDPNGLGLRNGRFIGLPFELEHAEVVLLPVPWDVTVSYQAGTSTGPENILQASAQLDLFDPDIFDAWKMGIYFSPPDQGILERNAELRPLAQEYIQFLESGEKPEGSPLMQSVLQQINAGCETLTKQVLDQSLDLLHAGYLVGIVGGDHSTPLGLIQALGKIHESFGILQIDAHMDLRKAYEGFTYSHASIFYNALSLVPEIKTLVQVGIRDYCQEEWDLALAEPQRIRPFSNRQIQEGQFKGATWHTQCQDILHFLPEKVYVSFDIDGLDPSLCPGTGTPVAGGLTLAQVAYLLKQLALSGRTIIGFDLCETAGLGAEWDGNVGARVLYTLCNWTGRTNHRV